MDINLLSNKYLAQFDRQCYLKIVQCTFKAKCKAAGVILKKTARTSGKSHVFFQRLPLLPSVIHHQVCTLSEPVGSLIHAATCRNVNKTKPLLLPCQSALLSTQFTIRSFKRCSYLAVHSIWRRLGWSRISSVLPLLSDVKDKQVSGRGGRRRPVWMAADCKDYLLYDSHFGFASFCLPLFFFIGFRISLAFSTCMPHYFLKVGPVNTEIALEDKLLGRASFVPDYFRKSLALFCNNNVKYATGLE